MNYYQSKNGLINAILSSLAVKRSLKKCLVIGFADKVLLIACSMLFLVISEPFFFNSHQLFGQTTNIIHYGVEEGLPQSQVQCIEQDNEGNLWIGTMAGLSKYNGREFENFTKEQGLAENWITVSLKDKSGDIWFGHWGGGVSKYNAKEKAFANLDFDIISQFKSITTIFEDADGNFWFGTDGSGIYRYDMQNNLVSIVTSDEALSGDHISSICQDNSGNIWIGTENGITIYNNNLDINTEEAYSYLNIEKGLVNNTITAITSVYDNEIWVGTKDAGIVIIKFTAGTSINDINDIKETMSINLNTEKGLSSNSILSIYEDNENTVWIGTSDAGVTQYVPASTERNTESDLARGLFKNFSTRQGLNYHKVNTIYQDREGNYWIGTEVGLNKYRSDRFQIYSETDGLINNIVWSVIEDSRGNMWFGTNEGVSRFSFSEEIATEYSSGETFSSSGSAFNVTNFTISDGLPGNIILSMCEDNDGNIWFGTANNGACSFSYEKPGFKTFTKDDGLPDNTINTISLDVDGNIWFGTKEGAAKYNPVTSEITNYTMRNGLGGNHIYRIFNDSKNNLWFGIIGGCLTRYNGGNFKVFKETEGIKDNFILSITEDKTGNIWLGAYGGGLYKYDDTNFINYSKEDGLSSESPVSITHDNVNSIWIGTGNSIDRFYQQTNTFKHYGKKEGFLGIETNANAIYRDKEGNIWFGTIMGAVKFNPKKDKPNTIEPLTSLTGLGIHLMDAEFPEDATFTYNKNHLTFHFLGIALAYPEKVTYKFMLEGFDEEWSPATSETFVTYANLPHGKYQFLIKANNGEGIWNETPASYKFSITPPFWKTLWFYGVCILVILGSGYLFVQIRTANLRRAKKELEEQVRLRTIELAHKNEELAEKNEDITASIRYAKRIQEAILPPDIRLTKHFPESFILFKPKDIVSGDFYWIEEKDKKLLFAAVDCTGHGVPGAFMSFIGHNILSLAIHEHNILTPGEILDNLNKGVTETLRQSEQEKHMVKDGMDLALCAINIDSKELEYAGAYNPLYLIRNNELVETRADRKPIGIYSEDKLEPFVTNKIKLEKGDTLYIFSDGYVDQFGGKRGKKFMNRRFVQLFLDIQKMNMAQQREHLDKTIEEWRTYPNSPGGVHDQVDDILIMGVRI